MRYLDDSILEFLCDNEMCQANYTMFFKYEKNKNFSRYINAEKKITQLKKIYFSKPKGLEFFQFEKAEKEATLRKLDKNILNMVFKDQKSYNK